MQQIKLKKCERVYRTDYTDVVIIHCSRTDKVTYLGNNAHRLADYIKGETLKENHKHWLGTIPSMTQIFPVWSTR